MTDETMTKEELQAVINEMSSRVVKVAELVDQVFPDQAIGTGIKDCTEKLCGYVKTFSAATPIRDEMDDLLLDDTTAPKPVTIDELKALALKNCIDTFTLLEKFNTSEPRDLTEQQLRELDIRSTHARELFTILESGG